MQQFRRLVVLTVVAVAATACRDGLFFDPAPASSTVALALSVNQGGAASASGPGQAFDAADQARVRLLVGGALTHEQQVVLGSRVQVDRDSVKIRNVGFSAQVGSAVLFATGDTVTGAAVAWMSLDTTVATVSQEGEVTSVGFGETVIRASAGSVARDVPVRVINPCLEGEIRIVVGEVTEGAFTADDCFVPETGGLLGVDFFGFTVDSPRQVVLKVTAAGASFGAGFSLFDSHGNLWAFPLSSGAQVAAPVALGPGAYQFQVLPDALSEVPSAYTVELFELPADFGGCPYVWTTPGGVIRGLINLGTEGSPYPPQDGECRAYAFEIDRWRDRMTGFIRDGTTFAFELVGEIDVMFSMFESFGGSPGKLRRQAEAAAGDTIRVYSYQDRRTFPGFGVSALNLNDGEEGSYTMRFTELEGPPPGSSIAGEVLLDGTGVQINWVHIDGPTSLRVRPDSMGLFDAFGLPAGTYTLRTDEAGFDDDVTELTLGANQDVFVTLDLPIRASTVTGVVTHAGAPVAGAMVTLSGPESLAASTDASGAYAFSELLAGTYTVTVSPVTSPPGAPPFRWRPVPRP